MTFFFRVNIPELVGVIQVRHRLHQAVIQELHLEDIPDQHLPPEDILVRHHLQEDIPVQHHLQVVIPDRLHPKEVILVRHLLPEVIQGRHLLPAVIPEHHLLPEAILGVILERHLSPPEAILEQHLPVEVMGLALEVLLVLRLILRCLSGSMQLIQTSLAKLLHLSCKKLWSTEIGVTSVKRLVA